MLAHQDPDAWRIFKERAEDYHRRFAGGDISVSVYRAALKTLRFSPNDIEAEVSLHWTEASR